jgi:hypothetical protein
MIPTQTQMGEIVTLVKEACIAQAKALRGRRIDPETGFGPVYVKVVENLARLEDVRLFPNYVRRTARWEAKREFLQSGRQSFSASAEEGIARSAFEEVADNEVFARLVKAVEGLPSRLREALLVTARAQDVLPSSLASAKTVKELANRWRCSRQHIYDLKDKAIQRIRQEIDRKWGERHAN